LKSNAWIRPDYHDGLRHELRQHLPEMGTNIVFENDTWFLEKLVRSPGEKNGDYTLYFSTVPLPYRDVCKYFVITRFCEKISVRTISSNLFGLITFFKYLVEKHDSCELYMIIKQHISEFESYLNESTFYKKSSKEAIFTGVRNFFIMMQGWDVMPHKVPVSEKGNPFNRTRSDRIISGKYIPDFITNQLDTIFRDECIPIHERLMYWLMRSYPSRVTEICSMELNCVKPSYKGDGNYVIFIPTWKQSGGYLEPEMRTIHVKDAGHGKFILDLIREQQEISNLLQAQIGENDKGMLFSCPHMALDGNYFVKTGTIRYHSKAKFGPTIANAHSVSKWFNTICRIYKVVDSSGQPYLITSHQLRHNGITDRFYDGFSTIEIRDMTAHKGDEMIETTYIHDISEKLIDIQRDINEGNSLKSEKSPIYFRGRILNMDAEQEARLLSNPRANKMGKLGICSDISGCKSGVFECLNCEFNIPDADELEYFEKQVEVWTQKVELFKNHKFMRENAEYNLSLNMCTVLKIKKMLSEEENKDAS